MLRILAFLLICVSHLTLAQDFIKVKGRQLVKGDRPISLRGVSFGNEVWSNVEIPDEHHDQSDYEKVNQMGMNVVRFYLNYKTFEDDDAPFEYKESGWKWLDKNIKWAKMNKVYLILNIHVPQGGFQSSGNGWRLWEEKKNQTRLTTLWRAIASRYADEPQIAGFDILNEPGVTDSLGQWKALANKVVKTIRQVDKNHMIVVERLNSINKQWKNFNGDLNWFIIDDPNILYEFHFYDPFEYTHQNTPWTGLGEGGKYPDNKKPEFPFSLSWHSSTKDNPRLQQGTNLYRYMEGSKTKIDDTTIKIVKPVIVSDRNTGLMKVSDITVKEYDPNGKFTRDVINGNVLSWKGWKLWSKNGTGDIKFLPDDGVLLKDALSVQRTTDFATVYNNSLRFIPRYGYLYSIGGWIKGERIPNDANCGLKLDFETTNEKVRELQRNKEYLDFQLERYVGFSKKYNVPIYLGEFGTYKDCFSKKRGALNWTEDMLDLLIEKNISFTYHVWHEDAFGIYKNQGLPDESGANEKLIDLFKKKLN